MAATSGLAARAAPALGPVTAVDIALEPDQTMIERAKATNARLLALFPKGFALDATHHPHVTMPQQFVRTADLDKVYATAGKVFESENAAGWKLKAFKYYYIPSPPLGLGGIVVEPTRLVPLTQVTATMGLAVDWRAAEHESNPTTQDGRRCLWLSVLFDRWSRSGKKREGAT
jgi:hypothetical protein